MERMHDPSQHTSKLSAGTAVSNFIRQHGGSFLERALLKGLPHRQKLFCASHIPLKGPFFVLYRISDEQVKSLQAVLVMVGFRTND